MSAYIPRLLDGVVAERLRWAGAVVIDGPKAVGKTATGMQAAASHVLLDSDQAQRQLAQADPQLVLDGAVPRLIDEWQAVPTVWNAVRRAVDERQTRGQFILTGSATPADDVTRHTGTGRFSRLRLRPLTLVETGHSDASVSLGALLDGAAPRSASPTRSLTEIVARIIAGGWPASQGMPLREASRYAGEYLTQIARLDIAGLDDVRHDPAKVGALLRALARTTATEASITTLSADAGGAAGSLHRDTTSRYLDALERAFILEVQEAWEVALRSRTPLRGAPKRHLVDTSLITAALRITSAEVLMRDPETLGFVFESLAMQQLRTLGEISDARVMHFRAASGLEVDAIVERADGAWGAFEVKLGPGLLDSAAATLTRFAAQIDTTRRRPPSVLAAIVPTGPSYVREDGVAVVSLTSLGA